MNHDLQELAVEQLLYDADELLRCARATVYESADGLEGDKRNHALAAVHLICAARSKVEAAMQMQGENESRQST